jgi:hypothetical protein
MHRAGIGLTGEREPFTQRLERSHGGGIDPAISLEGAEERAPDPPSTQLLKRLADHTFKGSRYQLRGELARGGMGAILKVWDEDLRRSLASQPRALHRPAVCPSHTSSRELRP